MSTLKYVYENDRSSWHKIRDIYLIKAINVPIASNIRITSYETTDANLMVT